MFNHRRQRRKLSHVHFKKLFFFTWTAWEWWVAGLSVVIDQREPITWVITILICPHESVNLWPAVSSAIATITQRDACLSPWHQSNQYAYWFQAFTMLLYMAHQCHFDLQVLLHPKKNMHSFALNNVRITHIIQQNNLYVKQYQVSMALQFLHNWMNRMTLKKWVFSRKMPQEKKIYWGSNYLNWSLSYLIV